MSLWRQQLLFQTARPVVAPAQETLEGHFCLKMTVAHVDVLDWIGSVSCCVMLRFQPTFSTIDVFPPSVPAYRRQSRDSEEGEGGKAAQ